MTSLNTATDLADDDINHYMREILVQFEAVAAATNTYNFFVGPESNAPAAAVIGAAQSIINSAAAMTRLLWPLPASKDRNGVSLTGEAELRRQWTLKRGKTLRKLLGPINEQTSPLGRRKVRNSFEHFDEYLDGFLFEISQGSRPPGIADMCVGPYHSAIVVDGKPPTYLRFVDNQTHEVRVLEESMTIQPLVSEALRISENAKAWLKAYEMRRRGQSNA